MACTEEKQNLRGIINHSGLSSPSSFALLPLPAPPTSYTPMLRADRNDRGGVRHAGLLYTYLPREDGYNLFCIRFRVREARFPAATALTPGFNGSESAHAVFWMRIYRAHAFPVVLLHRAPAVTVTRQILIHRDVISSFIFIFRSCSKRPISFDSLQN